MINNIVDFPMKDERRKLNKSLNNQGVLEGGSADLRNDPTEESSLQKISKDALKSDIKNLSKTALKNKYELTYSAWRNMKQRAKQKGNKVDADFEKFASFLLSMEPCPRRGYTVDRRDNNNPLYGPGLCRWIDKKGQANNRSSTIFLTSNDGECLPLTTWAARTNQKPDTMRRRRANGWSDKDLIAGKRSNNTSGEGILNFQLDPIPWRGCDSHLLALEKQYQRVMKKNPFRWPNRYEAYILYIERMYYPLCERVRRCTHGASYIFPGHSCENEEAYYSQFEPSGELEIIDELIVDRDKWGDLLVIIQDEYEAWKDEYAKRKPANRKEDQEILRFIKSKANGLNKESLGHD